MDSNAKLTADTLRKMANIKQMLVSPYDTGKIINGAADLIESLAAELVQAQSMLETRTRERDAAVEKLDRFCDTCKFVGNAYGEYPCPSHAEYDHCDSCPAGNGAVRRRTNV